MNRIYRHILAATVLCAPLVASAQLGFLRDALNAVPGAGAKAPAASPDSILVTYVSANKDVLMANADMAEALGMKDEAARSRATAAALGEGATVDALKEADKAITSSTEVVAKQMEQTPKLDKKSKSKFSSGLLRLASGLVRYSSLRKQVTGGLGMGGGSPLGFLGGALAGGGGVTTVAYIGTNLPTSMTQLGTALNNAINYAKNNDIPVPDDATQALAGLL